MHCVINCTHGYNGEDGSISGLIKLCNIPFASPDNFTSSFSLDKEFTKIVLKGIGIKTLSYKILTRQEFETDNISCLKNLGKITYPIIIKPARLGSSIGITTANDFKELLSCVEKSFKFDDKLLIEPLLLGFTEINCAVYKGEKLHISELEKPISKEQILSFADKYEGDGQREFPAKIDKSIALKIKNISKKVYTLLNFTGVIRIDYIVKDNEIYLNEINTIPGSMAYYLFCDTFKEFSNTLQELIDTFSIDRISKHGAKFDLEKAKWFNHQYLQKVDDEKLAEGFLKDLENRGVIAIIPKVFHKITSFLYQSNYGNNFFFWSTYTSVF